MSDFLWYAKRHAEQTLQEVEQDVRISITRTLSANG